MDELPEGAKIDFTAAMNSGQFAANRFRGQTVVLVLVFVLAFYGLILVLAKIFSFIRLIFSLFILPGTPVSRPSFQTPPTTPHSKNPLDPHQTLPLPPGTTGRRH